MAALSSAILGSASLPASAPAAFGFLPGAEGFSVRASEENGAVDNRAGSHPHTLTIEINLNPDDGAPGQPGVPFSDGDVRNLQLEMPPGLLENPSVVPACSQLDFHTARSSPYEIESLSGESCPDSTQIGLVEVRSSFGGGSHRTFGVFNLAAPPGAPSEFGFNPYGAPIVFVPRVRQADGEYGLTLRASDIPQLVSISGLEMTIWGTPLSPTHDPERGNCLNEMEPALSWGRCSVGPAEQSRPQAYLTLPSSCAQPMIFTATADSWQQPGAASRRLFAHYNQGDPLTLEGCGAIPFDPSPRVSVTNPRASSPSGVDFALDVGSEGLLRPKRLNPSAVKRAVVSLPEGMTINPSVGAGLGACSPAQYAAETASSPPNEGCPNSSKIGDFTVRSPLFDELVEGALFLAAPFDNPSGSLIGVYLVAKAPERGILVKVAGALSADPDSGRLVASFESLPQLPYTNLLVHFREGQRSPLATPASCGDYMTEIDLSPWRAAGSPRHGDSVFSITNGASGGLCSRGATPFNPEAQAGSINSHAGSYAPFYLHLTRQDTEQEITSYSTVLPPGLTGRLADIPYCADGAIEAARHRDGFAEAEHPSCPAAAQIGHTVAGFGLGPALSYAPGSLYLAGPFRGSPFSIVAIDSATVGPFDLGTIVIRSAIKVDRQTARVSIDSAGSDPIPHIIDGIPIHLRDVRVYISRPTFTLNPTSCDRFSVASALGGSGAAFSDPTDDSTATATAPYQAYDCGSLGFAPRLNLRLRGGTERGAYPGLRAEVRPRPGDANLRSATVTLPPSEFLAQNHIGTICTRGQFNREDCPPASVYGHARAISPLLSSPLEGNVYLRASDSSLPDLVVALRGGGSAIAIDIVGRIDAVRGGLRGRFDVLPDAPVSKFVMTLMGGKHGLLVNSEDVCARRQLAHARLLGQNNRAVAFKPRIRIRCERRSKERHEHRTPGGRAR